MASLAVESDIMARTSAHLNGNCSPLSYTRNCSSPNGNVFTYPTIVSRDSNHNAAALTKATEAVSNGVHSNLNDVIANLTDFTRHEHIRQLSLTSNGGHSPSVISNGGGGHSRYSFEPLANSVVKRLASESENSSSISPSLSERSNGVVSWSDQVQCYTRWRNETPPSPQPYIAKVVSSFWLYLFKLKIFFITDIYFFKFIAFFIFIYHFACFMLLTIKIMINQYFELMDSTERH